MVKPKWLSNLTQAKVESDAQGVEKRRQKRDEARGVVVTVTSWNHGHLSLSSGSQLIQLSYSLSCLGWQGKFPRRIQRPGVDDTLWYGHLLTTGIWHWQINRQPYDRGWVNHFSQGLSQLSGCSVHRFSCFCITCGSSFHGLYPAPRIWERPWENFFKTCAMVFFVTST